MSDWDCRAAGHLFDMIYLEGAGFKESGKWNFTKMPTHIGCRSCGDVGKVSPEFDIETIEKVQIMTKWCEDD